MTTRKSRPFLRMLAAGSLFLAGLTTMTALSEAQAQPVSPQSQVGIQQVANALDLDANDRDAFVQIIREFELSMESVLEKYGVDPSEGRPPLRVRFALRSELQDNVALLNARMAEILDGEQLVTFQRLLRERMQSR